jgi:DNA-binding HxlR family transcriptional regulator
MEKSLVERLNKALYCINTEAKSVLLGFLVNEDPKSVTAMREDLEKLVYNNGNVWIPSESVLTDYCYKLVELGVLDAFKTKGAKSTRYGKRHVKLDTFALTETNAYHPDLAKFALRTAVDSKRSMWELFGTTGGKGVRSPFVRFLILHELVNSPSTRSKLSQKIDVEFNTLASNLEYLSSLGFIKKSRIPFGSKPKYEVVKELGEYFEDKIKKNAVKGLLGLYRQGKFRVGREFACEDLYSKEWGDRSVRGIVNEMLSQGYIRKIQSFCYDEPERLTVEGTRFGLDFVTPFMKVVKTESSEPLFETRVFFETSDLTQKSLYISAGLNLYYKTSHFSKRMSPYQRKEQILTTLKAHNELTFKELRTKTGITNLSRYLSGMVIKGSIKRRSEGKMTYYSLNEASD